MFDRPNAQECDHVSSPFRLDKQSHVTRTCGPKIKSLSIHGLPAVSVVTVLFFIFLLVSLFFAVFVCLVCLFPLLQCSVAWLWNEIYHFTKVIKWVYFSITWNTNSLYFTTFILLHLSETWVKIRLLICQPLFFNSFLSLVNCKLTHIITSIIYHIKSVYNIDSGSVWMNKKSSHNITRI